MSVDITVMLSTYVKCKKGMKTEKKGEFFCDVKSCKKYNKTINSEGEFCSNCGKKLSIREIDIEVEEVDPFDMTDGDAIFYIDTNDKYDVFLPNSKSGEPKLPPSLDVKRLDTCIHEVNPESIPAHIEWFKKKFKKQISMLEEAYGKDNVSIHFGLINWVY
jgi:hypothetical protein